VCQRAHGGRVIDGEGLPPGHVQARLLADERHAVSVLGEHALERVEIDIPLEGEGQCGIASLRNGHVVPDAAGELDVYTRGREVQI
jgi:hypothetical protein